MNKIKLNLWREGRVVWRGPFKPQQPDENQEVQAGLREVIHHEQHGDFESADKAMQAVYQLVAEAGISVNDVARLKKEQLMKLQSAEARGPVNEGLQNLADRYRGRKKKLSVFARYKTAMEADGVGEKMKHLKMAWKFAKVDDRVFEDLNQRILDQEHEIARSEAVLERFQKAAKASEDLIEMQIDRMSQHLGYMKYNPQYWGDVARLMGKKLGLWWKKRQTAGNLKTLELHAMGQRDKLQDIKNEEGALKGMVRESIAGSEMHLEHKYVAERQFAIEMRDMAVQQKAENLRQIAELEADPGADAHLVKILKSLVDQADKDIKKFDKKLLDSEKGIDKFLNKRRSRNLSLREWLEENADQDTDEMREARERRDSAIKRMRAVTAIMKSTGLTSTEAAGDIFDHLLAVEDELPDKWDQLFTNKTYAPALKFLLTGKAGETRLVFEQSKMLSKTAGEFEFLLRTPRIFEILTFLSKGKNLETKALEYMKEGEDYEFKHNGLHGFPEFVAQEPEIEKMAIAPYKKILEGIGFKGVAVSAYLKTASDLENLPWEFLKNPDNRRWLQFFKNGNKFEGKLIAYDGGSAEKANVDPLPVGSPKVLFELLAVDNIKAATALLSDAEKLQKAWSEYVEVIDHNDVNQLSLVAFFEYLAKNPLVKAAAAENEDSEAEGAEENEGAEVAFLRNLIRKYGNINRLDPAQYLGILERANKKRFHLNLDWTHLESDLSFLFEDSGYGDPWKVAAIDQMMEILDAGNADVFKAIDSGQFPLSYVQQYLKERSEDYIEKKIPPTDVFDLLHEMLNEEEHVVEERKTRNMVRTFAERPYVKIANPEKLIREIEDVFEARGNPWEPAWENLNYDLSVFFGEAGGVKFDDVLESVPTESVAEFIYFATNPDYSAAFRKMNEADFDMRLFHLYVTHEREVDDRISDDEIYDWSSALYFVSQYTESLSQREDYPERLLSFLQEVQPAATATEANEILTVLNDRSIDLGYFEHLQSSLKQLFVLQSMSGKLDISDGKVWEALFADIYQLERVLVRFRNLGHSQYVMDVINRSAGTQPDTAHLIQFLLQDGAKVMAEAAIAEEVIVEAARQINNDRLAQKVEFDDLARRIAESGISAEIFDQRMESLRLIMSLRCSISDTQLGYIDINDDEVWGQLGVNFDDKMKYVGDLIAAHTQSRILVVMDAKRDLKGADLLKFVLDPDGLKTALEGREQNQDNERDEEEDHDFNR